MRFFSTDNGFNSSSVSMKLSYKTVFSVLLSLFVVASPFTWGQALTIGDPAPDFVAQSSKGEIKFHTLIQNKYALLFSHPQDFTPVCATELAEVERLLKRFKELNTTVIGLSVDTLARHKGWEKDILKLAGSKSQSLGYPIIADENLQVAKLYGMLGDDEQPSATRTPKDNKAARTVFLIGPDKRIRMILTYPMTTGRNFDEIVRVLQSVQLTDKKGVATPVNWTYGQDVVVSPGMSTADAESKYGKVEVTELPSKSEGHKDYLRTVKQP